MNILDWNITRKKYKNKSRIINEFEKKKYVIMDNPSQNASDSISL